jgi:hypothetical protein
MFYRKIEIDSACLAANPHRFLSCCCAPESSAQSVVSLARRSIEKKNVRIVYTFRKIRNICPKKLENFRR